MTNTRKNICKAFFLKNNLPNYTNDKIVFALEKLKKIIIM